MSDIELFEGEYGSIKEYIKDLFNEYVEKKKEFKKAEKDFRDFKKIMKYLCKSKEKFKKYEE